MNNSDMPAMANSNPDTYPVPCAINYGSGLTKREQFCLQMGVPETGDPELDDIIRKGNEIKLASMAMQGLLSSTEWANVTIRATEYAKETLKELNK